MQAPPTFEDLAIDDELGDLERIQKYAHSNIALQRLVHVKMLVDTAKVIGFEAAKTAFINEHLLEALVDDAEFVVRQHLAEQISGLCTIFSADGGEVGYNLLMTDMLPLLSKLVSDSQAEVRHAASEGLVIVAELLRYEDQGQHILTIVLQLSHDDEQEELRMAAVILLNQLAEHLGPELCHQFVTPEIISLSEDRVFRVRKATASNIDSICRTAGTQDTLERLLPAYLRLSTDDVWAVRKACAESLCEISKAVDEQVRVTQLIQVLEAFIHDDIKWVRSVAFQQLGPFLATLPQEHISPKILGYYISMLDSEDDCDGEAGDEELKLFVAFSFPAVALALGRARWNELSNAFALLVRDVQWQVRRTLSFSLHEIGKILGPILSEQELLGPFDLFLRDVDEVKVGVVSHLGEFLQQLGPACRESYLPILKEIHHSSAPTNWRFRNLLASELPLLSTLFTPPATFSVVVPLVFELIQDAVACVRQTAFLALPKLINRLGGCEKAWQDDIVKCRVAGFAAKTSFQERQIFLDMCKILHTEITRETFCETLLPLVIKLGSDPVPNVRLKVCRFLWNGVAQDWLRRKPEVQSLIQNLLSDRDKDVSESAETANSGADPHLDDHTPAMAQSSSAPAPAPGPAIPASSNLGSSTPTPNPAPNPIATL